MEWHILASYQALLWIKMSLLAKLALHHFNVAAGKRVARDPLNPSTNKMQFIRIGHLSKSYLKKICGSMLE